jgi:hypothetical protein
MARLLLSASALVLSATALASAQTSPAPTPTANPVKLSGNVRAFYFTRSNAVNCDTVPHHGAPGATAGSSGIQCNAAAFNLGGKLHGDYQLGKTPWALGASFFGADPFGANGNNAGFNPRVDNSLPGIPISVLGEAYLQYKNKFMSGQIGREIINTPWAGPSDSRIVPSSFQGAWVSGNVSPSVTVAAYYMGRFHPRTGSGFYNWTLLTSCEQQTPVQYFDPTTGAAKTPIAGADPCASPKAQQATKGFAMLQVTKKFNPTWVANLYQYQVYDIVNITHIDTKYNFMPKASTNPFVAAQYVAESDTGKALVGTIHAHIFGLQYGMSLGKNIDFVASFNQSPQVAYRTTPANCASIPGGVFGGVAATKSVAGNPILCYGGGVASPYSDSYATDPLYTTSISQGMADVHKPGSGMKAAFTVQSDNHKWKGVFSGAQYYYALPTGVVSIANAVDTRKELNIDVQYFFAAVDPKKPYHGLSIRHRYADRSTYFGAGITPTSNPDFKYNRTQLEWTF